jgi:hypothetical protein
MVLGSEPDREEATGSGVAISGAGDTHFCQLTDDALDLGPPNQVPSEHASYGLMTHRIRKITPFSDGGADGPSSRSSRISIQFVQGNDQVAHRSRR